jgi:hypothetical protein
LAVDDNAGHVGRRRQEGFQEAMAGRMLTARVADPIRPVGQSARRPPV